VTIEEMERRMIIEALRDTDSQQRAAERLGISARTIRNKLKKYREEGYAV
jgi:transposase